MSFVEKCVCESCVFVFTASSVFLDFKFLSFFALLNSPFHGVLIQEAVFKRPWKADVRSVKKSNVQMVVVESN